LEGGGVTRSHGSAAPSSYDEFVGGGQGLWGGVMGIDG
jgi:hypothetical protein